MSTTGTSTIPVGMFSGIEKVKARIDANYIRPGHYLARIDVVKADKTRKQDGFVAIEMTILHVIDNDNDKGHSVGENVSHLLMQKHDAFLGNMKSFVANVFGMMPEEITEQHCTLVCSTPCPLTGTVVEFTARNITTRLGSDFTAINYRREVPAAECIATLSPQVQILYFPNNLLQNLDAAFRAQQAQQPSPAQQA